MFGTKLLTEIAKLLIAQCFNRRCVDTASCPLFGQGDSVLGHDSLKQAKVRFAFSITGSTCCVTYLPGASVRGHKDGFISFQAGNRLLLKVVKYKGKGHGGIGNVHAALGYW